jgi:hypothetical protein
MFHPVARLNAALLVVLVLTPVFSACASSGGSASAGGSQTAATGGGNSTVIARTQLAQYAGRSALDVIQRFNRRWLRAERGGGGEVYARVVIDGGSWYSLNVLYQLSANDVESLRFLNVNVAIREYGASFRGGVIEVTSRRN